MRGVNVNVPNLFMFFLGVLLLNVPIPDLPTELRRLGQSRPHGRKPHCLAVLETSVTTWGTAASCHQSTGSKERCLASSERAMGRGWQISWGRG